MDIEKNIYNIDNIDNIENVENIENIKENIKENVDDENENGENKNESEDSDSEDNDENDENDENDSEENSDNVENVENIENIENSDNIEDGENNNIGVEISEKRPLSPTDFSKNSIISISRKAGIKCISQCGIEKVKTLLHEKIKVMNNHLASFYTGYGKTITKQVIIDFLDSEGIHFTHMVKE